MIKHITIKLAALGSGALLFGSSLAQANPSTPMTVIDSTAGQLAGPSIVIPVPTASSTP